MTTLNERRKKLIADYYSNKIKDVEILVDNVWDPHNVAAVSRTADGLGLERINLYYTYNEFPNFSRVGKKSSSSANKWIKFERVKDLAAFAKQKKKEGFIFIGTDLNSSASRLDDFKFPDKCVIVLGAESEGLSPEVKAICDRFVFIPMVGMVQSYNISVAAGMVLYEVFRQKGKNLKLRESVKNREEEQKNGRNTKEVC